MRAAGFVAISLSLLFLCACSKDAPEGEAPGITDYRTYELVTVAVKDAGTAGFALLCKNSPADRRTASVHFLAPDGSHGAHVALDALPRTIEGVAFDPQDLLYTDVAVAGDGTFFVVGTGTQSDQEDRLHLIVQHIDRDGTVLSEPFRRYITTDAVVAINAGPDLQQDLHGLPRQRALCGMSTNGDLVVAVRWETTAAAGIRLYRFPVGGGASPVLRWDHTLDDHAHRLQLLACDPVSGNTTLVMDSDSDNGHGTEIWTTSPGPSGWNEPVSATIGLTDAEPQQLVLNGSAFLLTGYRPGADGRIDPFVCRFTDAPSVAGGLRVLDGLAEDGRPVAAYCTGSWEGRADVLVQTHQASATAPYFNGDITSDLAIVRLDGQLAPSSPETIIPGQGLRAMLAAEKNGRRIVIGVQHPFLNAAYQHTFYLVLE